VPAGGVPGEHGAGWVAGVGTTPGVVARSDADAVADDESPPSAPLAFGLYGEAKLIELHREYRQLLQDSWIVVAEAEHGVAAIAQETPDSARCVAVVDVPALPAGIVGAAASAAAVLADQ
jgi:hypothetical protein